MEESRESQDAVCRCCAKFSEAAPDEQQQQQRLAEDKRQQSEDAMHGTSRPPSHSRHNSSKYDFVKVRVWLGENADHYYVLSRFLVSRMLTVTKIPSHVAIKISLELKKLLIDNSLLDVSQTDLEANLFKLMERRGYGEEYISRYKMMTRFHHQRVPLVILVCGTACVGKSTVATQLAQRLHLPNVLQTDMVYELIRTSTDAPLVSTPIWERYFSSPEELVTEFARECRIVRKGLNGDLKKAMKDGKPIIIEGIHLDPRIYLMDEQAGHIPGDTNASAPNNLFPAAGGIVLDADLEHLNNIHLAHKEIENQLKKNNVMKVAQNNWSSVVNDRSHDSAGSKQVADTGSMLEEAICSGIKTRAKAIIIPIILKMDEFDHKTLLEEWIGCRSYSGSPLDETRKDALINKLMTIQEYLCSFKSQGITVMNISATTFQKTIDALHSYLLQRIEEAM